MNHKGLILTVVSTGLFAVLAACGAEVDNTSAPQPPPPGAWYSGGTLHEATVGDWKSATAENRLATSADFVMAAGGYESIPSDLRERAVQFEACVSTGAQDTAFDTSVVRVFGAACALLIQN